MAAVIGALRAVLSASIAQFTSDMGKAGGETAKFASKFQAIGSRLQGVGTVMSAAITAPFIALVTTSIPAAREADQAAGQVEAALKSMGGQSGKTADELDKSAAALMRMSTFDDDEILRKVTANLLTFGSVAGEQFDRAQRSAVDLATRMNMDLQPATLLIGKALNDPIKGMNALKRAGIQLTEQQKDLITGFVETGNVAKAQDVILGELERQFGGSAKAMRDATPGADLKNSWDDFQETLGGFVINILPPLTAFLSGVLDAFNNLSPGMQGFAVGAAAVVAAVGPLLVGIGSLFSLLATLAPAFAAGGTFAAGGAMAGFGAVLAGIGAAIGPVILIVAALVAGFMLFKDKLIPVFEAFQAKFSEVLGPKFSELIETVKAVLTELWNGPLGEAVRVVIDVLGDFMAAYLSVFGEAFIRVISAVIEIVGGMFNQVASVVRLIAALLRGDWAGAWDAAKSIVTNAVTTLLRVIDSLVPGATDAMRRLYEGVKTWLQDRLGAVFTWVSDKTKAVGDAFFELYDRVVGHSYIPDMVNGIAEWMAKLPAVMVTPATDAANQTAAVLGGIADSANGALGDAAADAANKTESVWQQAADGIGRGLADMVRQGEFSLRGLLALAVEVLSKIGTQMFGGGGGSGSGGFDLGSMISSGIQSFLGGARADGGPVMAGRSYLVGERGPELFTPRASGGITSNENMQGGGTTVIIQGVKDPGQWQKSRVQLAAEIGRAVSTGRRGM